jgi:predicted Holliday junction resolvase-like endonuclease
MFILVMVLVVMMIVMIIQFNPVQFLFSNSLSEQPNGQAITETVQLKHKLQRTINRTMKQTQTNKQTNKRKNAIKISWDTLWYRTEIIN